MKTRFIKAASGFSLIEILVTVGLLSVIVLGLLAAFNQTQRAFRSSLTQTDLLEAGRSIADMMGRDLEQMAPSQIPDQWRNGRALRATNFLAEPAPRFDLPLRQELPGTEMASGHLDRTNIVQQFFFVTKVNQDWVGIGYKVLADYDNAGVGTLYRFCETNFSRSGPLTLSADFLAPPRVPYSRIADGIVHLRVRAFATNGFIVTTNYLTGTNGFVVVPGGELQPVPTYSRVRNAIVCGDVFNPVQSACYFMSNAVPAFVELELGILENRTLQRYRAIPVPAAQQAFLSNHVANVHLFRQRIPIRNVDTTAYQ